ncbi:hypothetical protein ACIG87_17080 [Micromonospora sp. NPDC051925]|uniref:hypothetical protein n=1 Tax=Micromonospora sp. NPDC051925 TaxID=3364288 RepID=UPI0037CC8AB1
MTEDAPRRRPPWSRWTALAVVLALLTCGLPAALLAGAGRRAADRQVVARPAGASADPAGPAGPADLADPADLAVRTGRHLAAQLDRQAAALLRGDRAGFLAIADRSARSALARRYAALRALRVTVWRAEPEGLPTAVPGQPGRWRQPVTFRYCLVVPDCRPDPVRVQTRWRGSDDAPVLLAVEESRSERTGPRPWEVSELVAAVGPRTVVATTPAYRERLPGLLAGAEAAAEVADRYAVAGPPPDRYRIFYAGRSEWLRWYGGGRPRWTAGYAVTVGDGRHEVVLNAAALTASGPDELLRHELTHAASLPPAGYSGGQTWWLVEGLAEYAATDNAPVDRYEGLDEVHRFVADGWDGRLAGLAPADDAPADRAGAAYGVGYLAVRHLADRYGEQRMLAFFRAVLHEGRTVSEASAQVFGEPWQPLHDECVGYVRTRT